MSDCETASNFDFGSIFTSCSQECSNDSVLIGVSAQRVVEDRENSLEQVNISSHKLLAIWHTGTYLRLNNHIQRGSGWCRPHRHWAQRPREVKEGIGLSHIEVCKTKPVSRVVEKQTWLSGCLVERRVEVFFGCGGGVAPLFGRRTDSGSSW